MNNKLVSFSYTVLLGVVFCFPLTMQAQQIDYGKQIYYKGKVNSSNKPSGKGQLVTTYKVNDSSGLKTYRDVLKGVFEDGVVSKATLSLGMLKEFLSVAPFAFNGTVEYSVDNNGNSVTYKLIDGTISNNFNYYLVTPDNTLTVIRTPFEDRCETQSSKVKLRNILFFLRGDLTLEDISSPSYNGSPDQVSREIFTIEADTTTAEGKYSAAGEIYSAAKSLRGWSQQEIQRLRDLGFILLIESAEDGYTPAQKLLWKQIIFNNDPNVENDKLALKYAEKVAEGTGEDAIDALLYLQKNYLLGPNNINNSYRDAQTMEGKARYVGPKDLKKSRLLLEKIMANESTLKYFVRKGGGFGRRGAELELNDLNKAIGDRPYKDFAAEISKKIIGTWKMAVYDGITSIYTFRSDGTFKATHTYTYPQLSPGVTVKFDVTGKWCVNKNNSIETSDYNRFQNIKASCPSNDYKARRSVNILNAPGDDKYGIITDMVRQCSGNLNYIGWMENNTFSDLEFSNGQMKASYNTWNIFKNVTLTKVVTQAKKPAPKRR